MKKQLLKFRFFNQWRLLFLAMMLFIVQGAGFSQTTITVTTDADYGAGSLRQAIYDAADGDIIDFVAAVTTITLDSTLNLGDSTITIDGGGDVVLERSLTETDSFRIVTIVGAPDKLITIKDLTMQNGLSKDVGGGLMANHEAGGKTMLENVIFKDNFSMGGRKDPGGGGAYILGYNADTVCMVTDCEFIGNSLPSGKDGAGTYAQNAVFYGCTFTENVADAGGGARAQKNVLFDHCTFTGNTASDAGGAIRLSDDPATASNCKFEDNSAGGKGGAVFAAKGTVINCEFIGNTGDVGGGLAGNNDNWSVTNCLFDGNTALSVGGGLYVDDGGMIDNCTFINNVSNTNGGGIYYAGNKSDQKPISTNCVVAHNSADSIGGGIYAAFGDFINFTIAMNSAGNNGGAFAGDGTWTLANTIVYGNDAAGDYDDIHIVSNEATTAATFCAIDVKAYDAGAWTATDITTLSESPFVGGTGADSLMVPYSSPLIDAGDTNGIGDLLPATAVNGINRIINDVIDLGAYERLQNYIVTTDADEGAGSLRQILTDAVDGESIITFADGITTILVDTTIELGDKTLIIDGGGDVVLDGAFNADPALDTCGIMAITGVAGKMVTIQNLTIQNGYAEDGNGGGLLADHSGGGQTYLEYIVFKDNTANGAGGGASVSGYNADTASYIMNCEFIGNVATGDDGGGAFISNVEVTGSTFTENEAGDDGGALWFRVATVDDCVFTGNISASSGGAIRIQDEAGTVMNSTFEDNSSVDDAGAVFMARGSVSGCEFINNSTEGKGGAISGNNNECFVDNNYFSGNSAGTIGGAVYMDDGGTLTNCVIIGNSAGTDGGGLYFLGDKAPATAVGCVIANNTATGKGGGVYAVSGDVINCILTENSAGINGGAFTGETGPWFIANSVVWNNDATGTDKNLEAISNSAADDVVYSAIDATAYVDTLNVTEVVTLDASPFIGGTEADSLYFPRATTALIDAGTVDYGIADVLPATDLEGADRVQGVIDLGVYETELIHVLSVSLDVSTIEMNAGETETLVATVLPAEADNKSINWTSSDDAIATVANGVVTGVSEGTATITATTQDGGLTATCDVTVAVPVSGITLDQNAVTLEAGENVTLTATVAPEDATNKNYIWQTNDPDVATVSNGVVTAVSVGTAEISVITEDGFFTAACNVTVDPSIIAVTGVDLDQTTATIDVDATVQLTATVSPDNATDNSVTWSSSDESVATVDASGLVTGVSDGTATITVETTDGGHTATAEITVNLVEAIDAISAKEFNIYPNPVNNILNVEGKNITSIQLLDITGKMIKNVQNNFNMINVSELESGYYLMKIETSEGVAVLRITKN